MSKPFSQQMIEHFKQHPAMAFVWEANMDDPKAKRRADIALTKWLAYLEAKEHHTTLRTWKFISNGGGKALTFPCEDPMHFDITYVPDDETPMQRIERAPNPCPIARKRLADDVRRAVAASKPPMVARRGDNPQEKPKSATEILMELREKAISDPVKLSPRLADKLGIRPPAQDAAE